MTASFEQWRACQRFANVTPLHVEAFPEGELQLRFLAQIAECDGRLGDFYDDEDVLAQGFEDEDETVEVLAIREEFMGKPCFIVVRVAPSVFGTYDSHAMDVEVWDALRTPKERIVERVRSAVTADSFDDGGEEVIAPVPSELSRKTGHLPSYRHLNEKRSWWQRLFS